jgi:hypothetical protein
METVLSVLWFVIPVTLGFGLVRALWPRAAPRLAVQVALSPGVGLGACSAVLFGWLLVVGHPSRAVVFIELGLAGWLGWLGFRGNSTNPDGAGKVPGSKLLLAAAGLVLGLAALVVILEAIRTPHGDVDAWGNWNVKAKILYLGGAHWRDAFTDAWLRAASDPGLKYDLNQVMRYPLLLPLSVAGGWLFVCSDSLAVPAATAALFTVATAFLLGSALAALRGRDYGLIAAAIFASSGLLIEFSGSQTADIPLGFFFLATFVLLAFYDREKNRRYLILAGITAGLAAWTKNEGLAFVIAVAVSRALLVRRRRDLLWYGLGCAVPVLMVLYVKVFLAPGQDYFIARQDLGTIAKLTDLWRYKTVGEAFRSGFGHPGLLSLCALILGVRVTDGERRGVVAALVTLVLMLMSYFMVFILIPFNLEFQIDAVINRLAIQVWPSILFLYFRSVTPLSDLRTSGRLGRLRAGAATAIFAVVLAIAIYLAGVMARHWSRDPLALRKKTELGIEEIGRREEPLKAVLPEHGVVGYTSDTGDIYEYVWTRYHLAPRIVVNSPEPEVVVLNRHDDGVASVEERAGMRLYGFGTGIYVEDRRGMHQEHPK